MKKKTHSLQTFKGDFSKTHCGDMMAMELRGSTIAVKIRLEMVMKIIRTVVEFLNVEGHIRLAPPGALGGVTI